jgi:hypothetical protein
MTLNRFPSKLGCGFSSHSLRHGKRWMDATSVSLSIRITLRDRCFPCLDVDSSRGGLKMLSPHQRMFSLGNRSSPQVNVVMREKEFERENHGAAIPLIPCAG